MNSATWRVLVFPGGTEIGLEIRQALAWNKDVILFSAGFAHTTHAEFAFGCHDEVPAVQDSGWLERLQIVVKERGITHIFPAHDDTLLALAENSHAIGAKVITSPVETCRVARSKTLTLQRLGSVVPTPVVYGSVDAVTNYPVFLKPDRGQGAQDTFKVSSRAELELRMAGSEPSVIQEYLAGPEFTVDCFSDREGGLLYAEGRTRKRIKSGIAMHSEFVRDERFWDYAKRISAELPFQGAWFYQVKADSSGTLKLLEVAPRIGGTSGLSRVRGVNLPLLSLYEADRRKIAIRMTRPVVQVDRALLARYKHDFTYDTLYVDLDDTLIVGGKVNVNLVRLIYQCLNRGVRLVLVTRHEDDVTQTLQKYRLSGVFDEIRHLTQGEPKASVMNSRAAIMIDDSFSELIAADQTGSICAIHSSAIDLLVEDHV